MSEESMNVEAEELPRDTWHEALDEITQIHEGDDVIVEVVSSNLGDQVEAERLPLLYLEYDYKDDAVIVALGDRTEHEPVLRHMIHRPRNVFVHPPRPRTSWAVDVVGGDGTQTLVTFYRPEFTE
jgi:hypothetical protein